VPLPAALPSPTRAGGPRSDNQRTPPPARRAAHYQASSIHDWHLAVDRKTVPYSKGIAALPVRGQRQIEGPCLACLYPDIADDNRYPCPGTPAVADILQLVGALAVFVVDTILMRRVRLWNYRRVCLSDRDLDGASRLQFRQQCSLCRPDPTPAVAL
jgi:hypothetical protein